MNDAFPVGCLLWLLQAMHRPASPCCLLLTHLHPAPCVSCSPSLRQASALATSARWWRRRWAGGSPPAVGLHWPVHTWGMEACGPVHANICGALSLSCPPALVLLCVLPSAALAYISASLLWLHAGLQPALEAGRHRQDGHRLSGSCSSLTACACNLAASCSGGGAQQAAAAPQSWRSHNICLSRFLQPAPAGYVRCAPWHTPVVCCAVCGWVNTLNTNANAQNAPVLNEYVIHRKSKSKEIHRHCVDAEAHIPQLDSRHVSQAIAPADAVWALQLGAPANAGTAAHTH